MRRVSDTITAADLVGFEVEWNEVLDQPFYATGGYAAVFFGQVEQDTVALKCFTNPPEDLQRRYQSLEEHIGKELPDWLVDSKWHDSAIEVNGRRYPILEMEFVDGTPLAVWIEGHRYDQAALRRFADNWIRLADAMLDRDFAHGDLQVGNIFVLSDGSPVLVDLDGIWVPGTSSLDPVEVGHPAFQHPARGRLRAYHRHVDLFAHTVIYASVLAIAEKPDLWEYHKDDRLILSEANLQRSALDSDAVWAELAAIRDRNCQKAISALVSLIQQPDGPLLAMGLRQHIESSGEIDLASLASTSASKKPKNDEWWNRPATKVKDSAANSMRDTTELAKAAPAEEWWNRPATRARASATSTTAVPRRRLLRRTRIDRQIQNLR